MKRRATLICPVLFWLLLLAAPLLAWATEETVCLQCHGGQSGYLGDPVPRWRESIHQVNGISCHHCHGGDPTDFAMAMSPERGFIGVPDETGIPAVCGRCHVGVLEDYQSSAHGQALGSGGPQCVTCHLSHRVQRAALELINPQSCSACHPYGRAEELHRALSGTEALIADREDDLSRLSRLGIATEELSGSLFSLRNAFHRLFHSVDVEKVRFQTAVFEQELGKIQNEIATIEQQLSRRRLWGGVTIGLLVLAGLCCLLIHRSYKEENGPS